MPSALVIGGQGVLGTFIARAMAAEGWEVWRGGRRAESDSDFRLVDLARPETVLAAVAGMDLVINCVPDPTMAAERTVLREGGVLLNVGSLQLAPRLDFESEGVTGPGLVVMHGGLTPGITTVVFKELLARFPDADQLVYGWASSIWQSSGKEPATMLARQFSGRRLRRTERIQFPEPVGRRRCIEFGRGEEGWFGALPEQHNCTAWFCLSPAAAMAPIFALNRIRALPVLSRGLLSLSRSRTPRRPSMEPKRDVMAVLRNDRRLGAWAMNGSGDYAMTVGATLAYVELLMERRGAEPGFSGIRGAENLFDLAALRPGLERRGVRFREVT